MSFHYWLDIIFDFFFIIDLVLTFKVAFITDEYLVLDDKKDIAKVYLNSWFVVDILSCIPYGAIGDIIFTDVMSQKIQMIKLIKILRILKLLKDYRKVTMYMDKYLHIEK